MSDARRSRVASGGLLERDVELRFIGDVVDRLVDQGVGATVLIEGLPGIGKSRLLAAAAERAEGRGATVLRARGAELEHELAFGGVRQLLSGQLQGRALRGRTTAVRGPAARAISVLDPTILRPESLGDPLFGLAALVADLAERAPVMLAIDDAHWLDEASSRFVAYLSRRIAGQPILIAATVRAGAQPLGGAIGDLAAEAMTLRPAPLSGPGVSRLLEELLGVPAPAELAEACLTSTGGIPLLVEEVARALAGIDPARRVGAIASIAPATIGRAVLDRIGRLPEPEPALAEAVALFPAGSSLSDAAAVAGIDRTAAAIAADSLVSSAVLAPGPRLAFLHPVMRSAVYEQLGVFRRRQGHARAATVLLDRGAVTEEIAAHLLAGEPAGMVPHVAVLEAAARQAEEVGALDAAVRYLARALEEPPPAEHRQAIRRRLGRLQTASRSPDAEGTLRLALADATTVEDRVDVAIELAVANVAAGHGDDAVEVLLGVREDASRLDQDRSLMVEGLLAAAAWESTRYAEVYASVADALPSDLPGTSAAQRLALTQVAARMFDRCEHYERVASVVRRVVDIEPDDVIAAAADLAYLVAFLAACCAPETAEGLALRWQQQARESGREALYAASQGAIAGLLWSRGEIVECEAVVRLAMDQAGATPADRTMDALLLVGVLTVKGDYDEAAHLLETAGAPNPGVDSTLAMERRRGQLALAMGRPAEAVELMQRSRAELERRGSTNPSESPWVADLADALIAVGRRDEAVVLIERMLRDAERFGEARSLGLALLAMGRLHAGPDALPFLERAVSTLAPSPYRGAEAAARLELGAALRRLNHRADARPHLLHALDHAERQGLKPMAERALTELHAAGARPRRRALTGIEALTPSERRIADLAAGGMTNREIATHLFLTVKTVEMHLANTFGKLDVASRRELPQALAAG